MIRRVISAVTAVLCAAAFSLMPPSARAFADDGDNDALMWHGGEIFKGCGHDVIALTFDDGPHPTKTDEILDILRKYDVKATFFEIGRNVKLYPDVTARVIAEGHEIGNHTYSHAFLNGFSVEAVSAELNGADDAIVGAAEYEPHFLRPPGGIYDTAVNKAAENGGKIIALWSIDTLDWRHRSCDCIVSEIMDNVRGGDVILMHDYISGDAHTAEALEIIIPELQARGYKFVTLSDMYLNYKDK